MKYSEHARALAMAGALGTIAGLLLWAELTATGDSAPDTGDRLIIAGAFALPVLFSLIGLARRRSYTAAWTAMLAVVYMGYALAEYLTFGGAPGLWVTLVSSSLLFAGSALYPRLRSREGL